MLNYGGVFLITEGKKIRSIPASDNLWSETEPAKLICNVLYFCPIEAISNILWPNVTRSDLNFPPNDHGMDDFSIRSNWFLDLHVSDTALHGGLSTVPVIKLRRGIHSP